MNLDPEDVFASAVGSIVGRFLFFLAAVWLGSGIGGVGIAAGQITGGEAWDSAGVWIFAGPVLLLSQWAVLNLPFLIGMMVHFVRAQGDGYRSIVLVLAVESFAVIAGYSRSLVVGALPTAVAWCAWLVVLAMAVTGVWMTRQVMIHRWLAHMERVRVEIARKAAENEARARAEGGDLTNC